MMEIKTVKDIAKFIRTGKTPPTQEIKYFNGEVNWYTPGDLDKGKYLSSAKRTLTKDAFVDKKAVVFPKNTLIVGCIGDIGKLGITVDECSSNQQLTGIFPNENVDVSYLYYWFKGNKSLIESYANNAVVPILNNRTLETIKIPLPTLPQQQKIANILDAADALRQNDKALIAKYDELTQALFLDMFGDPVSNPKGWSIDTLGNYCKKIQIGPFGSQLHMSDYVEVGIPLINPTNIKKGSIQYKSSVKITDEKYDSLPNYHLNIGDIVMARRGDLSKIGIVYREKSFCGTGSLYLRLKENINIVFCYWLLSHRSTVEKLYEQAQGVTMANLNKNIILKLPIVIPPIKLQNQFAERLSLIQEQKAIAQASLVKSEELFNSLMQKAFKGEL
jgi:type I restriction enzyme S subunit